MKKNMNMQNFKRSALALAVTAALPLHAAEEPRELPVTEAAASEEQGYKVDKASSPKLTQPVANTPKTINVISGDVLEDQGVTSLNDALRNVAGVSTFGGGEGGGGVITANDKVTIRGFDARSSIYVDGIRDVAGYSRDLFNYEQVEVVKGASGSLDGRSTGGGSVNLSTKRAKQDTFASVSAGYDSFDTKRMSTDVNQQLTESLAGRVNLLYTDGGDTFDNGEENYETIAGGGSVLFNIGEKTDITFDVLLMEQDNVPVLGLPFVTESAAEATGLAEGPIDSDGWDKVYTVKGRDYEEISTRMFTLTLDHEVTDGFALRSQTRLGTNEKESVIGRPWWGSDGDNSLLNATRLQAIDEENELFVTQLDGIFSVGNDTVSQDIVVGVEYAKEKKTAYGLDSNFTYYDGAGNELANPAIDPVNYSNDISASGSVERNGNNNTGEASTLAFYVLDTIKIADTVQVDLNARYDNFEIEGEACGRRSGCADGLDADEGHFSYGAAVSYMPTENGTVYIGYSNAQQPPGTELALSTAEERNELEPESAKTIELGTKWELLNDGLMLSAAIFQTTKDVVDSERVDVDGETVTNYYLTGEQKAKGFELGAVGSITDNLSVSASFVKLDTEVTQDLTAESEGNGLQGSPDKTANLWVSYAAMEDKLNVGGGLNYNSGETFWRRNTAYFEVDPYTTAYLMASYQATDDLKVQLNIDNVTDKEYVTDYSAKGHFRPGAPRSFALNVKYDF